MNRRKCHSAVRTGSLPHQHTSPRRECHEYRRPSPPAFHPPRPMARSRPCALCSLSSPGVSLPSSCSFRRKPRRGTQVETAASKFTCQTGMWSMWRSARGAVSCEIGTVPTADPLAARVPQTEKTRRAVVGSAVRCCAREASERSQRHNEVARS